MADMIELEARISALEMVVVTHMLQAGIGTDGFDPTAFAQSRGQAWSAVGQLICDECGSDAEERRFAEAYASALQRLGELLVALSAPVQEAFDEVLGQATSPAEGNGLQEASREAVEDLQRRESSGGGSAGAGDIG